MKYGDAWIQFVIPWPIIYPLCVYYSRSFDSWWMGGLPGCKELSVVKGYGHIQVIWVDACFRLVSWEQKQPVQIYRYKKAICKNSHCLHKYFEPRCSTRTTFTKKTCTFSVTRYDWYIFQWLIFTYGLPFPSWQKQYGNTSAILHDSHKYHVYW